MPKKDGFQALQALKKSLKARRTDQIIHPPKPAEPDAAELFRRAMEGVRPLGGAPQAEHPPKPVSPWPRKADIAQEAFDDGMTDFWPWDELEPGEQLVYLRPGIRITVLRQLRKHHWPTQAELDLHGENTESARTQVAAFLEQCCRRGLRCVRIIHGKGIGSRDGMPILKLKLKNWLVQRNEVLAFSQAASEPGSGGSVLILLRNRRGENL